MLWLLEFRLVSELILHSLIEQLETALFRYQLTDHSGVGFPLLFCFWVPVVHPEVLVRFKDWQLVDSEC